MTRLEKKCLFVSVTLHGLLGGILLFSAGFGTRPEETQMEVLTMIPANLLDRAGSGGGGVPNLVPQRQAQRRQTAPVAQPQPAPVERVIERRRPEPVEEEQPIARANDAVIPTARPKHHHHEVHPNFTTVSHSQRTRPSRDTEASETQASSRNEQRRLKEIENAFEHLAGDVGKSGASDTLVDVRGIGGGSGGGPAFAGYREAIFSMYYRAWLTPDAVSHCSPVDARIVVARDGTILSHELLNRSGDSAMDNSVRRAMESVTKLPAFPADARDEERTFVIRFNLESKESSG